MGLADTRTKQGGMQRLFFFQTSPGQFFQLVLLSAYPFLGIPFYRRPRRRFILIPFCNVSPGTGRKSFPGQKLKGLKARRNDSTLSYVHYHFPFCCPPYTMLAQHAQNTPFHFASVSIALRHRRYYILFTLYRLYSTFFYDSIPSSFSNTHIYTT